MESKWQMIFKNLGLQEEMPVTQYRRAQEKCVESICDSMMPVKQEKDSKNDEPSVATTPKAKRRKTKPESPNPSGPISLSTPEKPGVAPRRVAGSRAVKFGQAQPVGAILKGPTSTALPDEPCKKKPRRSKGSEPEETQAAGKASGSREDPEEPQVVKTKAVTDPLEVPEAESSDEDRKRWGG